MIAPAARRGSGRRLAITAVSTAIAFAILVGLGTWQLQRLSWKEALIADIEARTTGAPRWLPPEASWPTLDPSDYEYRRVSLTGRFESEHEALVFRPQGNGPAAGEGPGYLVLMPMRLSSGAHVIVDRGYVPAARQDPATRVGSLPDGETTVTGLMRGPESRNLFTPADDPARGQWFTRDPAAIARAFGIADAAPFTVDADDTSPPGAWPKGGQTLLDIPNSHLSYALTWYGLALALLGVVGASLWKARRRPISDPARDRTA